MFKDLEEAQKAFNELNKKHDAEVKAHATTNGKLEKAVSDMKGVRDILTAESNAHAKTKEELKTAQEIAEDAVSKANEAIEKSDPNVYVTFNKEKYRVNFGVNGKTKEEVREDKELVSKLVRNGSGALTKV